MPTPTLGNIPYQRNPFFTGREDVLAQLHRALQADARVALSHPQGISGLGGIGKTQTALEYAYRYRSDYNAIFWVRADSVTSLNSSMIELAHVLNLPERNEQDQEVIVEAVLLWLRLHPGWLLIYDNIDDLSIAESFLPKAGQGHLLFTTRARSLGGVAQRLDIQKMEPEIGALLLLRRADMIALQAALEMANPDERRIARAISQELDGLPLALDQAGAYIKEAPCSLSDYLSRYRTRRSTLLGVRGNTDQGYPASVATTWSLSFERVRESNSASAELLHFCAFLASDAIPEEILASSASHLGPILSLVVPHPMQLDGAYKDALRFSLITREADAKTLTMHRLVQSVLQDTLSLETCVTWKNRVVSAVDAVFPHVEFEHWTQCERLLSHALVCAIWIEQEHINNPGITLLHNAGRYLHDRVRYQEAEVLLKRALSIREQQLGLDHPDTAACLNNLATVYHDQGKYAQAEPLLKRALSIHEQQSGLEHPDTAACLNNLANLYYDQGKFAQAERLLKRALAINERVFGSEHRATALSLNNLARFYTGKSEHVLAQAGWLEKRILVLLYYGHGKYARAEPLLKRAMVIWKQLERETHPDAVQSLSNLAHLYYLQGKYAQAEPLLERALFIREQQLGELYPDTAESLNNLAEFYRMRGKYAQAELLYHRALAINERVFGSVHPATANSLNNLALLYHKQGKYAQAGRSIKRVLAITEQLLGPKHPHTQIVRNNHRFLLSAQKGEQFGRWVVEIASGIWVRIVDSFLGIVHPDSAIRLSMLARLYRNRGKDEEAEFLLKRVLAIKEERLGASHHDIVGTLNDLALLYESQGKYVEEETALKRTISINEQTLGNDHPNTAGSLNNLAGLYRLQGDYARAIATYHQVILLDPQNVPAYNWCGYAYSAQGDYTHAIDCYTQAIVLDPKNDVLYNLRGDAYRVQGDYPRAIADYDRAIVLDPSFALSYHNRGDAYGAQGDYPRAIADYEQALLLNPDNAYTYNGRGNVSYWQEDYVYAIEDYSRAILMNPKTAVFYYNRANAYYAQGNDGQAIVDYEQAILLDPKYVRAYNGRGNIYSQQGDYAHAIADFDQALLLDPNDATASRLRQMCIEKCGL